MVKLRDYFTLRREKIEDKEFILLILCKKDKKTSFSILLQIEGLKNLMDLIE